MKKWIVRTRNGMFLHRTRTGMGLNIWEWNFGQADLFESRNQAQDIANQESIRNEDLRGKVFRPVEIEMPDYDEETDRIRAASDAPSDLEKLQLAVDRIGVSIKLHGERLDDLEDNAHTPDDRWDEVNDRLDTQRKRIDLTDEQVRHLVRAVAETQDRIKALERPSPSHGWRLLEKGETITIFDQVAIHAERGRASKWVQVDSEDIGREYTDPFSMGIFRRRF